MGRGEGGGSIQRKWKESEREIREIRPSFQSMKREGKETLSWSFPLLKPFPIGNETRSSVYRNLHYRSKTEQIEITWLTDLTPTQNTTSSLLSFESPRMKWNGTLYYSHQEEKAENDQLGRECLFVSLSLFLFLLPLSHLSLLSHLINYHDIDKRDS